MVGFLTGSVGVESETDSDDQGDGVHGNGHELNHSASVSESTHQRREEIRDGSGTSDHIVTDQESPSPGVFDRSDKGSFMGHGFFFTGMSAFGYSGDSEGLFSLRKPLGSSGVVGKNKEGADGDHSCGETFNDEQPLPASNTVDALETVNDTPASRPPKEPDKSEAV